MRLTSARVPEGAPGVNEIARAIFASGVVKDAAGQRYRPEVSVPLDTGSILYDLVRATLPNKTIEVGLAYGISTLFITQALRDNAHGRHVAIDPHQATEYRSIGLRNLERAGLRELVDWRESRSDIVLPKLWQDGERFELAFIDGCHLFDVALLDFYYIDKMLTVGGHIIFDDLWMPAIRKVISFALRNQAYEIVRVHASSPPPLWKKIARVGRKLIQDPLGPNWKLKLNTANVAVLRKIDHDHRAWDHYRRF